jgi:predicted O-methyltransferase YrrM
MAKTISDKIHGIGTDIFQDLDILEKDTQGWSSTGESFNEAIKKLKPKTIIEVGTWKGASAINMAKLTLAEGVRDVELEVICVDTFLGSYELLHYGNI